MERLTDDVPLLFEQPHHRQELLPPPRHVAGPSRQEHVPSLVDQLKNMTNKIDQNSMSHGLES